MTHPSKGVSSNRGDPPLCGRSYSPCEAVTTLVEGDMENFYASQSVGVTFTLSSLFHSTGCQVDTAKDTLS